MSHVTVKQRKGKKATSYCVQWTEPGTIKTVSKTFHRRREAEDFRTEIRRQLEDGTYRRVVKMPFDDWMVKHLENRENSLDDGVSPKTLLSHREALRALQKTSKPRYLTDVTYELVKQFRRSLIDDGRYAHNTINKFVRTIRATLSCAVRDGYLKANPLLGQLRLELGTKKNRGRVLEVGEVQALINQAQTPQERLTLSLAYYHGLRRGEICWLRWEDVDLLEGILTVASHDEHRTKTGKSRQITIRQETAILLSQVYPGRVSPYIFENPVKFFNSITRWFPRRVKAAGLDHCTMHDLRRTCNTLMMDKGTDPKVARQIIGNTEVVNDVYYTGQLKEKQRLAVNSIPSIG